MAPPPPAVAPECVETPAAEHAPVSAVLAYTDPPVRRRLGLSSELRLDELHRVLQAAFGWEGHHLHRFSTEHRTWDDGSAAGAGPSPFSLRRPPEQERETRIGEVMTNVGDRLVYTYDFGDSWEHILAVELISEREEGDPRACLVDADRAAPPEDCGGMPGYENLVAALSDPAHPESAHLVEWYAEMCADPATFDPAYVDVGMLDRAIRRAVE